MGEGPASTDGGYSQLPRESIPAWLCTESGSGSMQEDPFSSSLWLLPGELVQLQV